MVGSYAGSPQERGQVFNALNPVIGAAAVDQRLNARIDMARFRFMLVVVSTAAIGGTITVTAETYAAPTGGTSTDAGSVSFTNSEDDTAKRIAVRVESGLRYLDIHVVTTGTGNDYHVAIHGMGAIDVRDVDYLANAPQIQMS